MSHAKATLLGIDPLFSPQTHAIPARRGRDAFRSSQADFRATLEAAHRLSSGAVVPEIRNQLHSWKEIAAYLKCEVRTAQRWEKNEGLPIHRHIHNKLSSIYAHAREIDEWWVRRSPSSKGKVKSLGTAGRDGRLRLAVLPFENLTSHPGQTLFSYGLAMETVTQLVHLLPHHVAVIAWTTILRRGNASNEAKRTLRDLRLNYLLAGSVRRDCNRVHITAQLIEVGEETQLWAKTYRGDIADQLGIQIVAARRIAQSLRAVLIAQQR